MVRPHDDKCEQIKTKCETKDEEPTTSDTSATDVENNSMDTMKHADSYDTAETALEDGTAGDCPICMEAFAVGDVVSWSSYERCSHVYHHQCIKEWLLRHNNCPFCREVFLPVDRANSKITLKVFRELSEVRAKRAEKTYYCVQDGLVTLRHKPCSEHHKTTTNTTSQPSMLRKCGHIRMDIKEKLKPGVTKAELKKLRGDRAEKICYGDTGDILNVIPDREFEDADAEVPPANNDVDSAILRNESVTTDWSDDDDVEKNSPAEDAKPPRSAASLVVEEAIASIGDSDASCEETRAQSQGNESSAVQQSSKPIAPCTEVSEERLLEKVEAGSLAQNLSATAIELELDKGHSNLPKTGSESTLEAALSPPAVTDDIA